MTKASNDRVIGWGAVHGLMRFEDNVPPSLQFAEDCSNLIRTMPIMVKDDKKPEDIDTELEDHAPDALRYMVMRVVGGQLASLLSSTWSKGQTEQPTIPDPLLRDRETPIDPNNPPDRWPEVKAPPTTFGALVAGGNGRYS